mmetsp:Transcript_9428/g.26266  ORF Transcript_9428/g.26266 Transcript_9428/m.26266 type:complete len:100 (-) Transcript_9428:180-479(-)
MPLDDTSLRLRQRNSTCVMEAALNNGTVAGMSGRRRLQGNNLGHEVFRSSLHCQRLSCLQRAAFFSCLEVQGDELMRGLGAQLPDCHFEASTLFAVDCV